MGFREYFSHYTFGFVLIVRRPAFQALSDQTHCGSVFRHDWLIDWLIVLFTALILTFLMFLLQKSLCVWVCVGTSNRYGREKDRQAPNKADTTILTRRSLPPLSLSLSLSPSTLSLSFLPFSLSLCQSVWVCVGQAVKAAPLKRRKRAPGT